METGSRDYPSEPVQPDWRPHLRRRRVLCFALFILGIGFFSAIDEVQFNLDRRVLGIPEGFLWLGVLLLAPVAVIAAVALWRCPACKARLPAFRLPACPRCGIRLFDDAPAPPT